jgi:osmotically-inducible protein OsmY
MTHGPDDLALTDAVTAFLRRIACADVSIEVASGVASLHGNVTSQTARTAIEDLVMAHDGVRVVINHLVVAPAAGIVPRHSS